MRGGRPDAEMHDAVSMQDAEMHKCSNAATRNGFTGNALYGVIIVWSYTYCMYVLLLAEYFSFLSILYSVL